MKRLRLCFVGPADSVSLRRWVEWFAERGHEATVITVEPAEGPVLAFRQVEVGRPAEPRKLARLLSAARMALTVRRLNPDVVHVHYLRGLAWGLPLAGGHPCVVTPWGSDVLEEQGAFKEPYSRTLTRTVLGLADLVTVHSAYLETRVREVLPQVKRMARIGWGVDLRLFRPGLDVRSLRERWDIGEGSRVIFSPRLAQPCYHLDRIVKALPAVCEKVPNAVLAVAEAHADPDYVTGLRRLASDLGLADRVRFLGTIPHSQMPLWLNLADAVVMVPRSDGMPNTLLEAMACGTVPILNRLPQYAEIISHGMNGFLVDPDDGDLAGAVIGVLRDAGLRRDVAMRNRTRVREVGDQQREMSKMETLYWNLAGVCPQD